MRLLPTSMIALLVAQCLSACVATTTPRTDAQLGETVNVLKAQQILNPEASRNTDPVKGVDGKAAKAAQDSYHESFRQPAGAGNNAAAVFGVGTSTGSSNSSAGK